MRKITCIVIAITLLNTFLGFGQAQEKYILFDQDILSDSLNTTITCKRTYVELESDSAGFPDLTIYNFLFNNNDRQFRKSEKRFLGFQNFFKTGHELPADVLITITPLTRANFVITDVTASIANGEIELFPLDSLLAHASLDIFHSIYAPMGVFEFDPLLKLKRTDYKLVVKRKNKYHLIDNETLTECYYIGQGPIEYYRPNAAGIFAESNNFSKKMCLNGGKLNMIRGASALKGGIMKDTSITIGFEKNQKIPIHRFWTLSVFPDFTKHLKMDDDTDWYPIEGIGDFEYFWKIGIINGNFLDFFKRAKVDYMPDKRFNSENVNFWYRTKTINGKKIEDFFKGEYIDKGLIKHYM